MQEKQMWPRSAPHADALVWREMEGPHTEGPGTACKPAMKMPDFPWKFITLKQSRLLWAKLKEVNAIRERKLVKRKCPFHQVFLKAGQPGWTQGIPLLWCR